MARWVFVGTVAGLGTLGASYLLAAPPEYANAVTLGTRRVARRLEWAMPVGLLAALFVVFVGVQVASMSGGDSYVLRTAGLTYAEYARRGFWQLLAVTMLTLAVVGWAVRRAARETVADRVWLRALLGALVVLTLVIVASALNRMWLYQEAYGWTVLRVLVLACELWLGAVYLLILVAGARLRAGCPARWWASAPRCCSGWRRSIRRRSSRSATSSGTPRVDNWICSTYLDSRPTRYRRWRASRCPSACARYRTWSTS